MCANSEGSGETARMRRLAWAFAGRLYDKYHNLTGKLKCLPPTSGIIFRYPENTPYLASARYFQKFSASIWTLVGQDENTLEQLHTSDLRLDYVVQVLNPEF